MIEHRVGPSVYRLRLPRSLNRLHPVFPVVKLLPAPKDPIPGRWNKPPPDPILVDGEEHYEVEAILDSRMSRGQFQFLIQWKGYSYEHNSWENATDVHSPALVNDPNCSAGSSLPKGGGNVKGLPFLFSYFLFHGSRVRTLLTWTRGFPWTPCTDPRYFRLFHMANSIHGPALYLNLFLHGPALYPNLLHTDPRVQTLLLWTRGFPRTLCMGPGYFRVFIHGNYRQIHINPLQSIYSFYGFGFPGHGFPGMDIIPEIGLLL